jgi:hypothetical protein
MNIELTITRTRNGRELETKASLGEEGWNQWGGSSEELGETVDLVSALQEAAFEAGAFREDEEGD